MKTILTLIMSLGMLSANAGVIFSTDFTGGTIGEGLDTAYGDTFYKGVNWINQDGYAEGPATDYKLVLTTNAIALNAGDSVTTTVRVKTTGTEVGRIIMDMGIGGDIDFGNKFYTSLKDQSPLFPDSDYVADTWYYLSSTFTKSATSGEFSVTQAAYNDSMTLIGSFSETRTDQTAIYDAETVYVGFRSSKHSEIMGPYQVSSYEISTSAIPEPATLGLITATGLGILFIRRRLLL
ncbi:PEP-CTERM sorting domain-containing protein [Pontiella sulfatireligans]|uniref:PEP-CTERM protein-sorting domain-containing protein n=1 Tax=Pontiella sulfatireligans TaxID=2750658 RepID=A0A6C2UI99_9BACT|nr:PEP-CTERM sorting domain-containing protein [Pontiella sulfatireligans]VGO18936.1 hypothetical protein SCARR_00989 [Pontiella sulfatireligans]